MKFTRKNFVTGMIAAREVAVKVTIFGGSTALAMWAWHWYIAHPHPIEHYFVDNTKTAFLIEAIRALLIEAWEDAEAEVAETIVGDTVNIEKGVTNA